MLKVEHMFVVLNSVMVSKNEMVKNHSIIIDEHMHQILNNIQYISNIGGLCVVNIQRICIYEHIFASSYKFKH